MGNCFDFEGSCVVLWWLSQDKDVIYYVTAYNENMPMPEKPEAGRETCTYMSVIMATKTCFAADECLMVCFWS